MEVYERIMSKKDAMALIESNSQKLKEEIIPAISAKRPP